jgi:MSHA biogenesis protein MshJ
MDLRAQWLKSGQAFDARKRLDRGVIALILLLVLAWAYLVLLHDPLNVRLETAQRQLSATELRMMAVQARVDAATLAQQRDPAEPLRQRLRRVQTEQAQVDAEIAALTGSLVSPEAMTQLLTSVLAQQPGLALLRAENRAPQALRGSEGASQVYRHGLLLEFEGDYLNVLQYLRHLEQLPQRFFWDSLEYQQSDWPRGRVRLELHTLSAQEGFVGV